MKTPLCKSKHNFRSKLFDERERKLARDWERLSYGQGFQGIEYALSTVTIYIYSSYIMGRYISYLDLILANVYNLEFLDVTVIYMSYMNVYIYICYTIYIYLDYTVTITFNSLLIMGLLVRYIVYIIYIYYRCIYLSIRCTVTWVGGDT